MTNPSSEYPLVTEPQGLTLWCGEFLVSNTTQAKAFKGAPDPSNKSGRLVVFGEAGVHRGADKLHCTSRRFSSSSHVIAGSTGSNMKCGVNVIAQNKVIYASDLLVLTSLIMTKG